MYLIKLALFFSLLYLFTPIIEAKKRCTPLLEKLHNIQAMQRNGYSAKRGASLRAREDKARDKWWQCEQGRDKKTNKKGQKKRDSKTVNNRSQSQKTKSAKHKKIKAGTPFKTNNAIVIKSSYQGEKKRAWLAFYQQPTRCHRPNNLQVFAFCSEDKQRQRIDFEQTYTKTSDAH